MKLVAFVLALVTSALAVALLQPGLSTAEEMRAFAVIRNANGETIGRALFVESGASDVTVSVEVTGLTPGLHGLHIHAIGSCVGPDFTSAAAHFNPSGHKHGLQTSDGPHAGDLPNLVVGQDGRGRFHMTVSRFTLSAGRNSLLDNDGSALVIHAAADDGFTDATGNSGARVACGTLTLGVPPAPAVPAPGPALSPPRTGTGGLIAP